MMLSKKQKGIAMAYLALQVVIWAKSVLFFAWFGFGKSGEFNLHAFPENAILFDYYFHSTMHVLIGVLALLLGASFERIGWQKLVAIVLAAVAIHNVAYWFTATHPSIWHSIFDFARDSVLLGIFVLAGFGLKSVLEKVNNRRQKN